MKKHGFSKLLAAATLLVSSVFFPAQAGIIDIKASDLTTISTVGDLGGNDGRLSNGLYLLAESQGAPWLSYGLLKFDLSKIAASHLTSDGVLRLSVASIWPGSQISTFYSLHTLMQSYDPATVSYNNFGGYGNQIATDSGTFSNLSGAVAGELTFTLSKSLLQSWAADPSTNHGLLLRFVTYSSNKIHSDMTFATNGDRAPALTFSVAEPAGMLVPLFAFGLLLLRRRNCKQ